MNKVFMIMGNGIAHNGHVFHPGIAEPPVSIKDDGEGGEERKAVLPWTLLPCKV